MSDIRLADYIRRAETQLAEVGVDNPALDARVLFAHVLNCDRAQLLAQPDRVLAPDELNKIDALVARRAKREPLHRILGTREFWGLDFELNEATLVPRPESETLIEATLNLISQKVSHSGESRNPGIDSTSTGGKALWISAFAGMTPPEMRILDLGTGTGCLLLSLLHELPNATGIGVDYAPRAIECAQKNAARLNLAARAEFKLGNWADGIAEKFDLVISNPPYIARSEISTLMPEVSKHDPQLALDGGDDGLTAYRHLIPQLQNLLKPDGFVVFEVGERQAKDVIALFSAAGFKTIQAHKDLLGIERCITAQ